MDVTGAIALIFFFTSVGGCIGGWVFLRHRERMSLIEKGIVAEDVKALYQKGFWRTNPLSSLKWGILAVALGLGLLVGGRLRDVWQTNDGITVGLMAVFGGIGLIIFYAIAKGKPGAV